MKYEGVKVQFHAFLTSAQDGGEWSASCSGGFTSGENAHDTHWMGLRAGLDAVRDLKLSL